MMTFAYYTLQVSSALFMLKISSSGSYSEYRLMYLVPKLMKFSCVFVAVKCAATFFQGKYWKLGRIY